MRRLTTVDQDERPRRHRARPCQAPPAQITEVGVPGVDVREDRQLYVALARTAVGNDLTRGLNG
jgi:hypothetical protein